MQNSKIKTKLQENIWKIQLISGILLIVGIFLPFSYVDTNIILEIIYLFNVVFSDSTGFISILDSELLTPEPTIPFNFILSIVGIGYLVIIIFIALLYIIYGIKKKEYAKKKSKFLRYPMWNVGLILFILTAGVLLAQGFLYYQSIEMGPYTFNFFFLHVGSFINTIISVLLFFAGAFAYGFKENAELVSTPMEESTISAGNTPPIPISYEQIVQNDKTKKNLSFNIISIVVLSCLIIAGGVGLVFWGFYILNTWHLVPAAWLVIFFWAGILWAILAIIIIGAGIIAPIIGIIFVVKYYLKKN